MDMNMMCEESNVPFKINFSDKFTFYFLLWLCSHIHIHMQYTFSHFEGILQCNLCKYLKLKILICLGECNEDPHQDFVIRHSVCSKATAVKGDTIRGSTGVHCIDLSSKQPVMDTTETCYELKNNNKQPNDQKCCWLYYTDLCQTSLL